MNDARLERTIGLVLGAGAIVSFCLLAIGIAGMGVAHVGPLDRPFPPFDLNRLGSDLAALKPAGFLWLGLLAVILTRRSACSRRSWASPWRASGVWWRWPQSC